MTPATAERRRREKRKPTRRGSAADPVTKYAREVVNGQVVVGRWVRLACERHLRDLKRQRTRAFPFWWNGAAALHFIHWVPTFIRLEGGEKPMHLARWAQFAIGSVFGWRRTSDDGRRFKMSYTETGKGSGKTPYLAATGLYGLGFDGEAAAEIYPFAFDRNQASIAMRDAIRMVEDSEDLSDIFEAGKFNIAHAESGSFMRALSSEHRSKSGLRPHFGLGDEIHEHRDGTVINKVIAGFKRRAQPVLWMITNSGFDRTTVCWDYHQHATEVLEQRIEDEQFFAYVCQLDPCQRCFDDGYRQPNENCEKGECDDWTDPEVWPKSNPSLSDLNLPGNEYLQTEVDRAQAMESARGLVMRLNFCIWSQTRRVWIAPEKWDACRVSDVSVDNRDRRPCAAGLDLSSKLDLSSLVLALRFDDEQSAPAEVVTIEGLGEDGQRQEIKLTLNFTVELVSFFWIPEATLLERVQKEKIPYDVWKKLNHLFATPGAVIDHEQIYQHIRRMNTLYNVQRLGLDERDATMMFVKLRDEARMGDRIVGAPQGKKLSEALKMMEVLIRSKRLRHSGNQVMAWCLSNAEAHTDRLGALWIEKPDGQDTKRIDGAVAAAMAIQQLLVLPTRRTSGPRAAWV
jgi:phage terminase large subunit-like protein